MKTVSHYMHQFALLCLMVTCGFMPHYAQADLVSTHSLMHTYTQDSLSAALASDELKIQLQAMGVDVEQLNDRIASLTPNEIAQLNAHLETQPAGGIVGVLVTLFLVFVLTDMLCATDLFSFVKCINR